MAVPCGYQQITAVSASVGLTVPNATNTPNQQQRPTRCIITAEAQAVRWRDDGVAPTAAVGYPLAAGSELKYDGDMNAIRFIEQVASAKLNVAYFY